MRIEFFGLSGAGKTHLAKMISRENKIPLIVIKNRLERYFLASLFIALNPRFSLVFLHQYVIESRAGLRHLSFKIFIVALHYLAIEQKARLKGPSLVDEGLFQSMIALYERPVTRAELERFKHLMPKDRLIHIIEAPQEVREKRLRSRKGIRLSRHGQAYIEQRKPVLEHNFPLIADFIRAEFPHQLIRND